jgi:hypothetical protein
MDTASLPDATRGAGTGPSEVGPDEVDDTPTDLAATAALIEAQRARVEQALDVDPRILFGTWGTAWLLGFGMLWAAAAGTGLVGEGPAGAGFGLLLVGAMVVTAVHLTRATTGVRGASVVQGAMYGWTWMLAFAVLAALGAALVRGGADGHVTSLVMTVVPALIVGCLYMAGGALWQDRSLFGLGAWILVVTAAGALVGPPHMLLIMSLAGGGGMLAVCVMESVRRRGRPRGAGGTAA